jgi:hypothetical protein
MLKKKHIVRRFMEKMSKTYLVEKKWFNKAKLMKTGKKGNQKIPIDPTMFMKTKHVLFSF